MNNTACEHCPCPDSCLHRAAWCDRLRANPDDAEFRRHIVGRSKIGGARNYPSVATQAGNLASSLWEWATSGFKMASDEEVTRRRAICGTCPKWVAETRRCILCGCQTEAKILLKTSKCPDDPPRW